MEIGGRGRRKRAPFGLPSGERQSFQRISRTSNCQIEVGSGGKALSQGHVFPWALVGGQQGRQRPLASVCLVVRPAGFTPQEVLRQV